MSKDNTDTESHKRQLRQAFGAFATGVTVVTAMTPDGKPIGFTANSFSSVSLDPPLLLVCLAKSSSNYDNFTKADAFAVNILGDTQKDISGRFAARIEDRFAETNWRESESGAPLIEDAIAWFNCVPHQIIDAGDHAILIGQVEEFGHNDKRPLAYLRGHYLELGLIEAAADSVSHHGGIRVGCLLENLGHVVLQSTPEGWTLPMGELRAGFREGRSSLDRALIDHGIVAELGFLYSVFDAPTGNATWMIFQGEMEQLPASDDYRLFALEDLPFEDIAIREVGSILRRFKSEFKESRFGLYVDDSASSGRINPIDPASTNWGKFIKEQVT